MKGIKSLSSRNLAFRGYNWQLKQEINMQCASAYHVLWVPEEDFNSLRMSRGQTYIAVLAAQTFRLVIFEQGHFRNMIWYIRAIFLNRQTYRDSRNVPERKSGGYDLVFPFPAAFHVPIFNSLLPLWNNLILYVQKWLVKNIALVELMAPVRDYTWA